MSTAAWVFASVACVCATALTIILLGATLYLHANKPGNIHEID